MTGPRPIRPGRGRDLAATLRWWLASWWQPAGAAPAWEQPQGGSGAAGDAGGPGAGAAGLGARPGRRLAWLLRLPAWLYRRGLGRWLGRRFLLLTHRGRRSGQEYQTVLEVIDFDPATGESVVVSGWGRRADWLRNLVAGGGVAVETGGHRYTPAWRLLTAAEARRVLARFRRQHRLATPLARRLLSGWPARPALAWGALARGLTLVAFRPRPRGEAVGQPLDPATASRR